MFRFIGNASVCGGITAVAFSVRGIAYLSLSHGLLWVVMALTISGHLWGTAVPGTSAFSVDLSVSWPYKGQCSTYLHVSTQHKKYTNFCSSITRGANHID